ncbi:MAG: divalent-cation tolerance protein CutA [Alphaproteobacteria bacterium]
MFQVVLTTAKDKIEAEVIAKTLLEEKLCACIQLFPISSYYHWEGKFENSSELLLLIKTRKELYSEVEKRILELHSYDVPEIISLPIENGFSGYLDWIKKETK